MKVYVPAQSLRRAQNPREHFWGHNAALLMRVGVKKIECDESVRKIP